jgi:hypothetical protein
MNSDPPPKPTIFPTLPIVTVDPPRLTEREKYGGLFTVGIAGLFVILGLVGWFGWSAWSLRAVWGNVYRLHKSNLTEAERIEAAYALSRDSRVNSQQRWDIALRKPLPPLARYLLAEAWTADTATGDPAGFAKIVALSETWPEWLRLLGVRLMAVAAAEGTEFPEDTLETLAGRADPSFRVWIEYIRAVSGRGDPLAAGRLRELAKSGDPSATLANELASAIEVGTSERQQHLATATRWMRAHDPLSAKIWQGWEEHDGRLTPTRP